MTTQLKKTLLIGIGVFVLIAASIGAVYLVRQPSVKRPSPTPTPKVTMSSPSVTPVPIGIHEVTPANAKCELSFVVACTSPSPSPTPSGTPIVYVSPSPSAPASADLDCVSKEVYADDARNRAGFYYLESRIAEASSLASGTTIVYSIIAKNHGGATTPDTKITDTLSSNLTFVDADSDCTYDNGTRTVTCIIGTLAAGAQAQRSIRARINVSSNTSIANTAEVFSSNGQRNSCSVQLDATGKILTPPSPVPTELPQAGVFEVTAGTIGVGMIFLILGALGLLLL
ncbi:MAG: hypothetical protein Fur0011_1090 [Candidatus Microgenomates bacterium]